MMPSPRSIQMILAAAAVALTLGRARKNLALHKPCTASSVRFGDPRAVVNGVVEWGNFALHTRPDRPAAWVMVDLQGTFRIDEVRVYPRGDELTGEEAAPLNVEISLDGSSFKVAGACVHVFSQVSPCKVRLGGASGRYVRLSYPNLALSEIEVFEAR
jgi:hypothetical protein